MREPDVEEIASYLDIPPEKVESHLQYMNHSVVISLNPCWKTLRVMIRRAEPENRNDSYGPEESLYYKEICRTLTTWIESLKEKERLVITLYYYEELKYAEIAEILEISESRVCQIHTKAITKLKEDLIEYVRGEQMFSGFYTAASGMLMNRRALDITADNMANQKTPGYRSKRLMGTTFDQELVRQTGQPKRLSARGLR